MSKRPYHNFGIVNENGDAFEFHYDSRQAAKCRLELVFQTERGPKRTELAVIPAVLWRKISSRVVRELATGMEVEERTRKAPRIKFGINRLGPLLGRELAVLFWALMEDCEEERVEGILHGWRELAREERWWLYTKAIAPGQRTGIGWRRALFLALSEPFDSRSFDPKAGKEHTRNTVRKQNSSPTEEGLRVTEIENNEVLQLSLNLVGIGIKHSSSRVQTSSKNSELVKDNSEKQSFQAKMFQIE